MKLVYRFAVALACGLAGTTGVLADTSDVQWQARVIVAKAGAHCADDPNCFNRYHPAIKPQARAKPGDHIVFETRDALDSDLKMDSVADDVTALDLNLVHPMTGPVHIEGAERGDVLAVDPGRHRAGRVRLHGHRARLRLPARPLPRAAHRQLAADATGRDLGPDARHPHAL